MKYGHFTMLPIGAFEPMFGRMRLHGGGGNPIQDIFNGVENIFSDLGGKIGQDLGNLPISIGDISEKIGQDLGNLPSSISDVGVSLDQGVRDNIPGGWPTVGAAALAAVGIYDPTLLSSAEAGTLTTEEIAAAGYDPVALSSQVVDATPSLATDAGVAATDAGVAATDAANTEALQQAFANPALPISDSGVQLASVPAVTSDVAAPITDQSLASLANQQPNYLTAGQNLGGSELGAGQLNTPLSALNDGTLGAGLTGTGAGLGLTSTGNVASAAGLGGATAADIGAQSLGQLGLAGSGAVLGPASAGALNGLGGGGSILSSLLPSSQLGQAALLSGGTGILNSLIGANASQNAANIQAQAARDASNVQQQMFNTQNAQLAPNRAAGYNALNQIQGMLPGQYTQYDAQGNPIGTAQGTGYFTNQMTAADLANNLSPGYAFGLNQGLGQAGNIANATGGRLGGNTLQGLNQYAQNYAQTGAQQAFNNYQGQRTNIYNTLAGIAGLGQSAQGTTADLAAKNAAAQSNLGVGSAAAQAAGQIGQAGAYTGGINNLTNNFMLASLLNPSSASNYVAPTGGYASTLGSLYLG